MHFTKSTARAHFLNQRSLLDPLQAEQWSIDIANQVASLNIWEASTFHLFLSSSKKKEVDTEPLLTLLQGKDKSVVCPKISGSRQLTHYLLTDQTKIVMHPWGIPEPQDGIQLNPSVLDIVFVPLLGFDKFGNRVGYGGGYYDLFLAECKADVVRIGLSFFDPVEKISPIESTDIPLHYAVTPQNIWEFKQV